MKTAEQLQSDLVKESVKRVHAEGRQATLEKRLTAAGKDRLVLLGQLKASQLLDRAKVRECMRDVGNHLGELQERLAFVGAFAESLEALQSEWNECGIVAGAAYPRLGALVASVVSSRDDLAALATAAGQANGRWRAMPKKERDDLAAVDEDEE